MPPPRGWHHHDHTAAHPAHSPVSPAGADPASPLDAFETSFEKSFEDGFKAGFEQALHHRPADHAGPERPPCEDTGKPWSTTYKDGQPNVDLGNYTLQLDKSNSQWTLTNKATGAQSKIWGDPHVDENGKSWDFKKDLTFQLDDGTKISVKTVPYGNGMTLSSELDITRGDHGMKITGLEQNNTDDALKITDGLDGYSLDASNFGNQVVYESGNTWLDRNAAVITGDVANQDHL